ncbi:hypothetical protein [Azospirillum sp. TSO22-1]|uniref:hypothetical protein n=1 Tax=Azospirillum sp. TSO22-1 TaxID=716789 RepID=UPI000D611531|nr:hypothetical protein [Azospirillum sp. TSO22-1]PWC45877.1 hypothetical protein TSO221_15095 [Azospirillum sp. TSO22-1]HYH37917.1 hypothetical protein [Azospirillum sp.]
MDSIRRTGDRSSDPIRPDGGGARALSAGRGGGRVGEVGTPGRQRIPSVRQLASLMVNGILTLPRNYRRGMFLDITA